VILWPSQFHSFLSLFEQQVCSRLCSNHVLRDWPTGQARGGAASRRTVPRSAVGRGASEQGEKVTALTTPPQTPGLRVLGGGHKIPTRIRSLLGANPRGTHSDQLPTWSGCRVARSLLGSDPYSEPIIATPARVRSPLAGIRQIITIPTRVRFPLGSNHRRSPLGSGPPLAAGIKGGSHTITQGRRKQEEHHWQRHSAERNAERSTDARFRAKRRNKEADKAWSVARSLPKPALRRPAPTINQLENRIPPRSSRRDRLGMHLILPSERQRPGAPPAGEASWCQSSRTEPDGVVPSHPGVSSTDCSVMPRDFSFPNMPFYLYFRQCPSFECSEGGIPGPHNLAHWQVSEPREFYYFMLTSH
jgi:hypothetical protein